MADQVVFPNQIIIRVDHPSPKGLAILVCIGMRFKNNYHDIVFLDADGVAELTGTQLLKTCDQERSAFIMDYVDPRVGFNGHIEAKIMTDSELRAALDAFHMFGKHLSYPEGYEQKLTAAAQRRQEADGYKVEIKIE